MPRQQGEPAFVAEEQLYRRLREGWIGIDGRVRTAAIDLPATSVDRGLLVIEPSDCLTRGDADDVAVGAIAFGDIPDRFDAPPALPYESVVVLKPENGNDAHSEIQFHRPGAGKASKPGGDAMKSKIKGDLAERMQVVHRRDREGGISPPDPGPAAP